MKKRSNKFSLALAFLVIILCSKAASSGVSATLEDTVSNAPWGALAVMEGAPTMPMTGSWAYVEVPGNSSTNTLMPKTPTMMQISRDSSGRIFGGIYAPPKGAGDSPENFAGALMEDSAHGIQLLYSAESSTPVRFDTLPAGFDATRRLEQLLIGPLNSSNPIDLKEYIKSAHDADKSENLGEKTIFGIEATGLRVTLHPGGPKSRVTIIRESWINEEKHLLLFDSLFDSRIGTSYFLCTDLSLTEPPPNLFKITEKAVAHPK